MKKLLLMGLAVFSFMLLFSACGSDNGSSTAEPIPTIEPSASQAIAVSETSSAAGAMVSIATVTGVSDGLNVRSLPSTDGEILGLAPNGQAFRLVSETEQDGWYQIEYNGGSAYISAEYTEVSQVSESEAADMTSSADETSDVASSGQEDGENYENSESSGESSSDSNTQSSSRVNDDPGR